MAATFNSNQVRRLKFEPKATLLNRINLHGILIFILIPDHRFIGIKQQRKGESSRKHGN